MPKRIPKQNNINPTYPPTTIIQCTDSQIQDSRNTITMPQNTPRKVKGNPRSAQDTKITIQFSEQNNNYFDNQVSSTKCKGCKKVTKNDVRHTPGCASFFWCMCLLPFGPGTCFIPFLMQSCLDIREDCKSCNFQKRRKKAKIFEC